MTNPRLKNKFYNNPDWQLRVNWIGTYLWLFMMVTVPFTPPFRHDVVGLLIMEVSLYANVVTHFTGISAAESVIISDKTTVAEHEGIG